MRGTGVENARPSFIRDEAALSGAEWLFLREAGEAAGAARQAPPERLAEHLARTLTEEALAGLELEGRVVARGMVEDCVRESLGFAVSGARGADALPRCVADLLADMALGDAPPFTVKRIREIGNMLGGKGNTSRLRARRGGGGAGLRRELSAFSRWFSSLDGAECGGTPLAEAGLAHVWFEAIQPFSFGTGIVGRVLAERAFLRPRSGMPFIPLSSVLLARRHEYFAVLDRACRDGEATEWLVWFGAAAVEAARREKAAVRALRGGAYPLP